MNDRSPVPAPRWEYRFLYWRAGSGTETEILESVDEMEAELNRLGAEGWEAVALSEWGFPGPFGMTILLKRVLDRSL